MNRREFLADDLQRIQISLAMRGQLNGFLPPAQWEPLRQRLQAIYRNATGESQAVLLVEDAARRLVEKEDGRAS